VNERRQAPAGETAAPAPWPVELALPLQWGEMDAFGHVNNAVYFRWFESARMSYFERLGWPELQRETGIGPILHSTSARFRAPLVWPDTIIVATRVSAIEGDRFTMLYEVRSAGLGRLAAEGSGLIVAFDYRRLAKAALPEVVRERIGELEGNRPAAAG
jgi:acyl-CoA thioester hydrolase